MDRLQLQYRCVPCDKIFEAGSLVRDRWDDPACPECGSPRLVRHRSKLSAVVAAYFFFNVV